VTWNGNQKTFKIHEDGATKLTAAPYTEYLIKAKIGGAQSFTKHVEPLPPGGEVVIKLPQPSTTTTTTQATTSTLTTTTPKPEQPNYAPIIAAVVVFAIATIAILTYRKRKTT